MGLCPQTYSNPFFMTVGLVKNADVIMPPQGFIKKHTATVLYILHSINQFYSSLLLYSICDCAGADLLFR